VRMIGEPGRFATGEEIAKPASDVRVGGGATAVAVREEIPAPAPVLNSQPSTLNPQLPPRSLTYDQCLEFAIGRIGKALGPMFAEIDSFPTRVRLPDVPLMLVDRILEIEGEPLSMTHGRVVTEKDIVAGDWYLDCGKMPTCLAVESGQADLFLSGWLGIDLQTRGLASYRLLDAVVTFHDELPGPGQTIHYDIRINHFFQQGDTYLFRFEFDATVNGQPLLTMRDGCAGFFTPQELAAGQGIIQTTLDRQPRPGIRPADWRDPVPMVIESYTDAQLEALRAGDLASCFGPAFQRLRLRDPVTLPTGRLNLVHRVLKLDPTAGKYGLGQIRAEADIHPDDWFLTCHFCDDQVMPGTLMYECCLHTLRIYLLRMGWIGEAGEIAYEPIPGIKSRLKCRGQVLATTKKVWYEVTLKEVGYGNGREPRAECRVSEQTTGNSTPALGTQHSALSSAYAIADALMYADGKPIVEITDMTVRLTGLTREKVETLWGEKGRGSGARHSALSTRLLSVPQPSTLNSQPPLHHRPHYGVRDRQAVGGVRGSLQGLRSRPQDCAVAGTAVSVSGPDCVDRKLPAVGAGSRRRDRRGVRCPARCLVLRSQPFADDAVRRAAGDGATTLRLAGGLSRLGPDERH
jgi:3-hydroxymyristoyl/3-hydroxydecanoyl-(acyl carrier protein) dehydratase